MARKFDISAELHEENVYPALIVCFDLCCIYSFWLRPTTKTMNVCLECVHDCKDSFWVYKLECCCRWWFNYYFLYVQRWTCVDANCSVVQSLLSIFGILINPRFAYISFIVKSETNSGWAEAASGYSRAFTVWKIHIVKFESDCATSNGPPFNILYTPSWYPSAEVFSLLFLINAWSHIYQSWSFRCFSYKHAVCYTSKLTLLSYHFILIQLTWGS